MRYNKKILTMLAVFLLIVLVVGATFAYFKAQSDDEVSLSAKIQTETTDSLMFEVGRPIALTANPETFAEGSENENGTSFAKAVLKANNTTKTASDKYNLYFWVTENDLLYTTEDKKPELLLKVTAPDETELTVIEGLEYKSVADGQGNNLSGFDITEFRGVLQLVSDYVIETTTTEEQTWNLEVIFVNLDSNQSDNGGKPFRGTIRIQKEPMAMTLGEVCKDKVLGTCIAQNYQLDGNIYYHKNRTHSAEDSSYRYAGPYSEVKNYICFGMDGDTCDNDHLFRIIGIFGSQMKLIKADFATEAQLGSTAKQENYNIESSKYYRGDLKEITKYYWSGSNKNTSTNSWASSTLNTTWLNGTSGTTFINWLGSTWANKIATTSWKVGGNSSANIKLANAPTVYKNEITSPLTTQTAVSNKIGLMYVSDYMYAAKPKFWPYYAYNNDESKDYRMAANDDWLNIGYTEWTITPQDGTLYIYCISSIGNITNYYTATTSSSTTYGLGVRPVFYINSNSNILASGDGTKDNPFILKP